MDMEAVCLLALIGELEAEKPCVEQFYFLNCGSGCRFRLVEAAYKEVTETVENWERSTGLLRPATPVPGSDTQDEHPSSGRKGKKGESPFVCLSRLNSLLISLCFSVLVSLLGQFSLFVCLSFLSVSPFSLSFFLSFSLRIIAFSLSNRN